VAALTPTLYPQGKTYRFPVVAPNTPRFIGDDTVLERPMAASVPPGEGIKPGLHKPRKGRHRVVWWDPRLLEEPSPGKPSIRRHSILQAGEGSGKDPGTERHQSWRQRRDALLEEGTRPSLDVTTATRAAETALPMAELVGVTVELVERVPRRPTGKAFGILVHEVLATTELDADEEHVRARAKALGRVLGNSEEEIAAASEATLRALAHPLLRRAASASRKEGLCHRESPIMLQAKDGSLVEGVMDLAFREGDQWTVVDFKTDLEFESGRAEYSIQVALYAEAIQRATNLASRGVVLLI